MGHLNTVLDSFVLVPVDFYNFEDNLFYRFSHDIQINNCFKKYKNIKFSFEINQTSIHNFTVLNVAFHFIKYYNIEFHAMNLILVI